jgi:hypothetical protein
MIEEMPTVRPILTNGIELPKKPKVTVFDWIWFYVYNWARKPFVWKKQRELKAIEDRVFSALGYCLAKILKQAPWCKDCACAYESLRPQQFLSQVKFMAERMNCDEHPELISKFLEIYHDDFIRAEEIAKWINGF